MPTETISAQDARRELSAEDRRVLADKIIHERNYAKSLGFQRSTLWLSYEDATTIAAALRAEPARGAEEIREACLKAVLSVSYGPPSSWPGDYPHGWRHPPAWKKARPPTPIEASWHDNGARDASLAIRALPLPQGNEGGADEHS